MYDVRFYYTNQCLRYQRLLRQRRTFVVISMRIIKSSLIQLIYRENKIHNHEFTFKKIKSRDKQLKVMNKVQDESEEGSR